MSRTETEFLIEEMCRLFKCRPNDLIDRIKAKQAGVEKLKRQLDRYKRGEYEIKFSPTGFRYMDLGD